MSPSQVLDLVHLQKHTQKKKSSNLTQLFEFQNSEYEIQGVQFRVGLGLRALEREIVTSVEDFVKRLKESSKKSILKKKNQKGKKDNKVLLWLLKLYCATFVMTSKIVKRALGESFSAECLAIWWAIYFFKNSWFINLFF